MWETVEEISHEHFRITQHEVHIRCRLLWFCDVVKTRRCLNEREIVFSLECITVQLRFALYAELSVSLLLLLLLFPCSCAPCSSLQYIFDSEITQGAKWYLLSCLELGRETNDKKNKKNEISTSSSLFPPHD